jgi:hypothetical protein
MGCGAQAEDIYEKKALRNAKELIGISIFMEHYNIALAASAERTIRGNSLPNKNS